MFQPADIPPIVTRGVLIDMTKHYGKPMLEVGDMYNRAEIEAAMKAQGVTIGKGDIVLFHTGWMAGMMTQDKDTYRSKEPGLGEDGAIFLADLGVVAVGSTPWRLKRCHRRRARRSSCIRHSSRSAGCMCSRRSTPTSWRRTA